MTCIFLRGRAPAVLRFNNSARRYVSPAGKALQRECASSLPAGIEQAASEANSSAPTQDGQTSQVKPYERRPLPLSPLMDPDLIAARQKWTLPKAPPSKTPTAFQKQLAKNPYAQALATPVRRCLLTNVVLPKYFLQEFNIMAHPETQQPLYVPQNLTSKFATAAHQTHETADPNGVENLEAELESTKTAGEAPRDDSLNPNTEAAQSCTSSHPQLPEQSSKIGPSVHLLGTQGLLKSMTKKGGFPYRPSRFGGPRSARSKPYARLMGNTIWRPDMDDLVLGLMRRRLVESLRYCAKLQKGYLVPCADWEVAKGKAQVGAFLWMEGEENNSDNNPSEFATLDIERGKAHKTPVHNLPALLGDELVKELKEELPSVFENKILALKHKRNTVDLQLRLWKLQGFLAG
ncbi:hypothetical protein BP6252_07741 [Coleophoma cylindrospora]|uniref:Uncharacterized protein n=1 Tax=Coleophoma cylindrospora TaxID=1849047 RepID=A0A3D8RB77_9HELO|nr:hypothetical protein BP6252_07741 [Coleophoma cylindrospora]